MKGRFINQTKEAKQKKIDEINRAVCGAYVVICVPNDIANSCMIDAVDAIRKSGRYKFEVKKICKDALSAYDRYKALFKQQFSESKDDDRWMFWNDYAEAIYDATSQDIIKIRMAFKSVFDEHNIPESDMKSYLFTADMLLQFVVKNFDQYFDDVQKRLGVNLATMFRAARLEGVYNHWDKLRSIICKNDPPLDLNKFDIITKAFRVFYRKVLDGKTINKAGQKIIEELYPEKLKYFEE